MKRGIQFQRMCLVLCLLAGGLAIVLAGPVSSAKAQLLMYEPFSYATGGTLNSTPATSQGLTGNWTADSSGSGVFAATAGFLVCSPTGGSLQGGETLWNGTQSFVPQTSNFAGSPAPAGNISSGYNGNNPDHLYATCSLASSVTSTFTPGATTWMSYVEASDFDTNGNYTGGSFALGTSASNLGSGSTDNRGYTSYGGPCIGIGVNYNGEFFTAGVWGAITSGSLSMTAGGNLTGPTGVAYNPGSGSIAHAQIGVAEITWGSASTPTTIAEYTFNNGATPTLAAFNTNAVSQSVTLNPAAFTTISLGGARYDVADLRIAEDFNDVIGVVVATTGNYWAPGVGGGGSGTWSATNPVWANSAGIQGSLAPSTTGTLYFGNTAGTVTLSGTVTAGGGLGFTAGGYVLTGTPTDALSLAGSSAAANTINVNAGLTNTISAVVSGSTGMSLAGGGTLILGSASNIYSGGTVLTSGVLQITGTGSLGNGNVTFQGGTLRYPPGSGSTSIDVSGQINALTNGQTAMIDTNGNSVTFNTPIGGTSGDGGLAKVGSGGLTLAVPNTYFGPTTVSGGTLNVSSASGTIAVLNVPTGGTANLNAGAAITTLNVTGGAANSAAAGVTVNSLVATAGTIAAAIPVTVTQSASLNGTTIATSGPAFTLSGANLVSPTSGSHNRLTANGGTLRFLGTGIAAAIGQAAPGIPALPATASFNGNGAWTMSGGEVQSLGNFYDVDSHDFQYISMPTGNFDIIVQVTGGTNAEVGLMARDNLATNTGDNVGIWTGGQSATMINGVQTLQSPGTGSSDWLQIQKAGNIVTASYSSTGVGAYTFAASQDFMSNRWGSTTYLGLDLVNTTINPTPGGAFANVDFMGAATMSDMSTTDIVLTTNSTLALPTVSSLGVVSDGGFELALSAGSTAGLSNVVGVQNLAGSGGMTNAGTVNLTLLVSNGSGTYAGSISDGASATTGLTMAGGSLLLTGTNTYSNGTTVSGGLLRIGAASALSTNGALTVSGGTLDLGGNLATTTNPVSFLGGVTQNGTLVNNGANYVGQAGTVWASLQGTAGLTKSTTAGLVLSGPNTYVGGTIISAGTLSVANATGLGASSGSLGIGPATLEVSANVATTGKISITDPSATIQVDAGQTFSNAGTIAGVQLNLAGGGKLVVAGSASISGSANVPSGTLEVDGQLSGTNLYVQSAGGGEGTGQLAGSGTIDLSGGDGLYYDSSGTSDFAGALASTTAGVEIAAGDLILSGSNSYVAGSLGNPGTIIDPGGTLSLASASALPEGTNLSVGGTLIFDPSLAAAPIELSHNAQVAASVPEPGTLALVLAGLVAGLAWRRKKGRAQGSIQVRRFAGGSYSSTTSSSSGSTEQ